MENGKKILILGLQMEKVSLIFVKILVISIAVLLFGLVMFLITGCIGLFGYYLAFEGEWIWLQVLFILDYVGIGLGLLGLPFYLMSLIYLGIGQIVINTSKE